VAKTGGRPRDLPETASDAILLRNRLPELSVQYPDEASRRMTGEPLGAYLALMLCYGAGNVANDFWLEHVLKRG